MNIVLIETVDGCKYYRSEQDVALAGTLRFRVIETTREHVLALESSTFIRFEEGKVIEQLVGDIRAIPFNEMTAYFKKRNTDCIAQTVEYLNNNAHRLTNYFTRGKKCAKISLLCAYNEYLVICARERARTLHIRSFAKRLRDKHGLEVKRAQLGDDRPIAVLVPLN